MSGTFAGQPNGGRQVNGAGTTDNIDRRVQEIARECNIDSCNVEGFNTIYNSNRQDIKSHLDGLISDAVRNGNLFSQGNWTTARSRFVSEDGVRDMFLGAGAAMGRDPYTVLWWFVEIERKIRPLINADRHEAWRLCYGLLRRRLEDISVEELFTENEASVLGPEFTVWKRDIEGNTGAVCAAGEYPTDPAHRMNWPNTGA